MMVSPPMFARGERWHRFMESSDFTAANRAVHQVYAQAVHAGAPLKPAFFFFAMEGSIPGVISESKSREMDDDAVVDMYGGAQAPENAVMAVVRRVFSDAESPYALLAFSAPSPGIHRTAYGAVEFCHTVAVEVFSADNHVRGAHRIDMRGERACLLVYRPLNFLGAPQA
jgi:hypothetical protein